jgi:hypothetical protein
MFLKKKELKKIILEERISGTTDQEIYNILIEKHKDKDELVLLLTESLKIEDRKKISVWNTILLILIGFTIVLKVLTVLGLSINTGKLWTLLLVLITPIINVFFFYTVLKYKIQMYKFIDIFSMLGFVNSIGKMGEGIELFINIFLSVSILGLSLALYLNNKPDEIKKDENGNHILV